MHSFVPRSMWNGPQNKPQGRQCVTHRRPQNLCLKMVPKTVPMKAQNVETVPDKLPNFHCHFIRRLTDISERALKTCLNKSLKHIWNINKHTKNIVKASFKYPGIISKTFLKHLWNMSESSLKHPWNTAETSFKHAWSRHQTYLKHLWNIPKTSTTHTRNFLKTSF